MAAKYRIISKSVLLDIDKDKQVPVSLFNIDFVTAYEYLVSTGCLTVSGGEFIFSPDGTNLEPESIESYETVFIDYQNTAKTKIDLIAGNIRTRFLTSVPGQEITYLSKANEFRNYVSLGSPEDLSSYPWIKAEVEAHGINPDNPNWSEVQSIVSAVLTVADNWTIVGTAIEKIRIKSKRAVSNVTCANSSQLNNAKLQIDSIVNDAESELNLIN